MEEFKQCHQGLVSFPLSVNVGSDSGTAQPLTTDSSWDQAQQKSRGFLLEGCLNPGMGLAETHLGLKRFLDPIKGARGLNYSDWLAPGHVTSSGPIIAAGEFRSWRASPKDRAGTTFKPNFPEGQRGGWGKSLQWSQGRLVQTTGTGLGQEGLLCQGGI